MPRGKNRIAGSWRHIRCPLASFCPANERPTFLLFFGELPCREAHCSGRKECPFHCKPRFLCFFARGTYVLSFDRSRFDTEEFFGVTNSALISG